MALPINFGAEPTGNINASVLDTQFNAVSRLLVIPCTNTGTNNAIVLTPAVNTPALSGYSDFAPKYSWTQATASSGNVTIAVAGTGSALQAYRNHGITTVGSSNLLAAGSYTCYQVAALNSGAGGFIVEVDQPTILSSTLGVDVAMSVSLQYYTGPQVSQGTVGTFLATGTVTFKDTAGASTFTARLWDGTNVMASPAFSVSGANLLGSMTVSGPIVNPVGNIRLDLRTNSTSGVMLFNASGNSLDTTMSVYRLA